MFSIQTYKLGYNQRRKQVGASKGKEVATPTEAPPTHLHTFEFSVSSTGFPQGPYPLRDYRDLLPVKMSEITQYKNGDTSNKIQTTGSAQIPLLKSVKVFLWI